MAKDVEDKMKQIEGMTVFTVIDVSRTQSDLTWRVFKIYKHLILQTGFRTGEKDSECSARQNEQNERTGGSVGRGDELAEVYC